MPAAVLLCAPSSIQAQQQCPTAPHSPCIPQVLFCSLLASWLSLSGGRVAVFYRIAVCCSLFDTFEELDLGTGFGSYGRYYFSANKLPSL